MTPEEFKNSWTKTGSGTFPISLDRLQQFNLNRTSIDFLSVSGLPDQASPFLDFVKDSDEKHKGIVRLNHMLDFLDADFENYIVVGSDNEGNPLVINTSTNNQIEWLDHDDFFTPRFMNSSINQLAHFLLIYREFNTAMLNEFGEDAILDSTFSDEQYEHLKTEMLRVDSDALRDHCFWNEELNLLLVNREY